MSMLLKNELSKYNFRDELNVQFEQRKKNNERYSLRAFAHFLNIDAPTLQKLMSGKRALGRKTIMILGTRLKLDPSEIEKYIEAYSLRRKLGTPLKNDSAEINYTTLGKEYANLVSKWSSFAVLELLNVKSFLLSSENVAKALKIPMEQAEELIVEMKEKKWIKQDETQKWISSLGKTKTDDQCEIITKASNEHMVSVIEKSLAAYNQIPRPHRTHFAKTVAIDRNLLPEYNEKLKCFMYELEKWAIEHSSHSGASEVYQLQLGVYPLTHFYEDQNAVSSASFTLKN